MTELPRRRLLAGTGTALAGALAGCSSSADDDDSGANGDEDENENGNGDESEPATGAETEVDDGNGDGDDEPETGTILGDIDVENVHDADHTVDVLVEFDGEIEHWTTHELEAKSGTSLDRDWTTDPGAFRVVVRLDGGSPIQIEPSRWNDPDCLNLFALVDRNGSLSVLGDTDGGHCGDGDSEFDEDA